LDSNPIRRCERAINRTIGHKVDEVVSVEKIIGNWIQKLSPIVSGAKLLASGINLPGRRRTRSLRLSPVDIDKISGFIDEDGSVSDRKNEPCCVLVVGISVAGGKE
jgi:hypothetical protein